MARRRIQCALLYVRSRRGCASSAPALFVSAYPTSIISSRRCRLSKPGIRFSSRSRSDSSWCRLTNSSRLPGGNLFFASNFIQSYAKPLSLAQKALEQLTSGELWLFSTQEGSDATVPLVFDTNSVGKAAFLLHGTGPKALVSKIDVGQLESTLPTSKPAPTLSRSTKHWGRGYVSCNRKLYC